METPVKSLTGMTIVRKLLEIKEQTQREAKENYRNNPELRAMYEQLYQRNKQRSAGQK